MLSTGMIEGLENIRDVFTVLHDGAIRHATCVDDDLILEVQIEYLAKRIDPSYEKFWIRLVRVHSIRFTTWPNSLEYSPSIFGDRSLIFKADLQILGGDIKEGAIQVFCSQRSPEFDYCGGELLFEADAALVSDEGGHYYSVDQLRSLCKSYWDDWSKRRTT